MSSREFTEWQAYDKYDPIGAERTDLGFAIVCSVIYNMNRGKGPIKPPQDFLPEFRKSKRELAEQRAKNAQQFASQLTKER